MRYRQLDGLRGAAAIVVLCHHVSLILPALAQTDHGLGAFVADSPLLLLVDGPAAVSVFFVLSGFVLTLAAQGVSGGRWAPFMVRRCVRLYLPVWGAVALAVAWALLVPRRDEGTWWLQIHARSIRSELLNCLMLVRSGTTWLNSPLWSLRWEVLFSLLLPAYLAVIRGISRRAAMTAKIVTGMLAGAIAIAVVVHWSGHDSIFYLGQFFIGTILAWYRALVIPRVKQAGSGKFMMIGLALIMSGSVSVQHFASAAPAHVMTAWGATLVVLSALPGETNISRTLERPAFQWLGMTSFSLYLTHEPLLVSLALLLDSYLAAAVAFPCALLLAWVFYRTIESPTHRLARGLQRKPLTA